MSPRQRKSLIDGAGLSAEGVWVRRQRTAPSMVVEALSVAHVLQTWALADHLEIERYDGAYAEVSGHDLTPTWVYLVELIGKRQSDEPLLSVHPLSSVASGEEVRLVALVKPNQDFMVLGALVETEERRRFLWLRSTMAH